MERDDHARSPQSAVAPKAAAAGKPSIAVLPFKNLSGEAEQDYFSDGITEDLITDLSKLSGLLVIARNSTFAYKGKTMDVREIGRELGVSHVLEGSVRRAGSQVRISAQLLQAASGHHLWAERYDRGLEDIFAVQDEITREIVSALDVKLLRGEQAAVWRKALRRPEALEAYYHGIDCLNRITREANSQAASFFDEVIRLEPGSPLGHLGAAWTHLSASRYGWADSAPAALQQAARLARRSLECDGDCANAHALLGYYNLVAGQHDEAMAAGERSVALTPNHADNVANLACSYVVSGRPAEGIALVRQAMVLSPLYPVWFLGILGLGLYMVGRYDEADEMANAALKREPAYFDSRLTLAAAHHARGREEDARREAREVLRHDPGFRLSALEARFSIIRDREFVARFLGLMRELGLQ